MKYIVLTAVVLLTTPVFAQATSDKSDATDTAKASEASAEDKPTTGANTPANEKPTPANADSSAAPAADPAAAAASPEAKPEECSIAVMNLQPKGLAPEQEHVAELLADSMAAEIALATKCRVVTQADIVQMLDFEATKAATCADGSSSCLAEIGGALGVERVVGGTVGKLGESFKLQVKLQNVSQGRVEARVDELIRGEPEELDLAARNAGRQLFGLEPLATNESAASDGATAAASDGAAEESGGILGTILMVSGGAVVVLAVAAFAGAIGYNVATQLWLFPSATPQVKGFLQIGGLASIGVGIAGVVFAVVGGAVGITGLFVE